MKEIIDITKAHDRSRATTSDYKKAKCTIFIMCFELKQPRN